MPFKDWTHNTYLLWTLDKRILYNMISSVNKQYLLDFFIEYVRSYVCYGAWGSMWVANCYSITMIEADQTKQSNEIRSSIIA